MTTTTNINSVISASVTKTFGLGAPVTYGPYTKIGMVTKSGQSNPRYRSIIENGGNATTPYDVTAATYELTPGYMKGGRVSLPNEWTSLSGGIALYAANAVGMYDPTGWESTFSPKAYNLALGSFLGNINSAMAPFKGLVFMAELKETLKMIRGAGMALFKSMLEYRKAARRIARLNRRESAKGVANLYLQYVYGWQPLLSDISSAAEAYQRAADSKDRIPVWGTGSDSSNKTGSYSDTNLGQYIKWIILRNQSSNYSCRFIGTVDWKKLSEGTTYAERLVALSGFSLNEFIPTLWELLPYSFVVDYFTNIGAILTAVVTNTGAVAWYSCSQRVDLRSVITVKPLNWYAADCYVEGTGGSCSYKLYRMNRSAPPLGIPSIQVFMPGLGSQKWLNLAALTGQKIL